MAYTIYKPLRPVRGVLFDMDGVILDSEKLYTRFWQEAGQALGYPMTREHALGMRALNRDAAAEKLKSYFGPQTDYPQIKAKRIALMDAYVASHGIAPKEGIRELLAFLKEQGLPCAVCTASPIQRIQAYLTPLGLFDQFDALCTVYQVPKGKPEPDIYLFGAKSLGLEPENCLALEDAAAGIESAWRAGCMAVMVPDQDPPDKESLKRITALADSLLDVAALIGRSMGQSEDLSN